MSYVLKTVNEMLPVLKHSVDGSAVKVQSDVAACWQSTGHHFIKNIQYVCLGDLEKKLANPPSQKKKVSPWET